MEVKSKIPISIDNPGIQRINERCVNCGVCRNICTNKVGICYQNKMEGNPACINCGQCILNCPMGAITPKYEYQKVKEEILNPKKVTVALISPAVRVSLGELFNIKPGTNVEKKMVKSLKKLGFNYVFDTTFGADLTVVEEANELLSRIKSNTRLPMFSSCCSSWVKYAEIYHPELLENLSSCKSPISMQNTVIKTYFANKNNIDSSDIVTIAITPCTSKKMEIKRKEISDGDYVLTTNELGIFLKEEGINLNDLEEKEFDTLVGNGSGAGVIFGNSGGVSEAIIRTIYHYITGKDPESNLLNYEQVRGLNSIKEACITIDNTKLNIAVVYGLPNLEKLLNNGINKYHFIEVMNCPGGCIGGGGQPLVPISKQDEISKLRIAELYSIDTNKNVRCSYQNKEIKKLYDEYLNNPLSSKSYELLHTTYQDKSELLKEKSFNI